jgi:thermitase
MNRQNFFGHLALAFTLVILAAFAGQMSRLSERREEVVRRVAREDGGRIVAITEPREEDPAEDAEVIVRFREGTTESAVRLIAERLNDRLLDRFEFVNDAAVIADEDGLDAESVAAEYRALPEVEYAEPNFEIRLSPPGETVEEESDADELSGSDVPGEADAATAEEAEAYQLGDGEECDEEGECDDPPVIKSPCSETRGPRPNDPMFVDQWALLNSGQQSGKAGADLCALRAWAKTTGSRKVVVAVLDTGVDYTHRDLARNMWKRPAGLGPYEDEHLGTIDDRHGFDAAEQDGDPRDDNGHGTHCAGIVGAEGGNSEGIAGVNWRVEIMPLKFMDGSGRGTTKDAIEAINYTIARKRAGVNVRVISASWGSTFYSRALGDAIRRAGEEGILFVAAAGNSSTSNDRRPHYPSNYPLPNVLSVASTDRNDRLSNFSNYGAKTVHLAAPGSVILSTWPGGLYEEHSGTSMATPQVAGVAALVVATQPDISLKDLRERLLSSVDKLPALSGKVATGGRLNAARAVRAE